jgi:hypothetical protein
MLRDFGERVDAREERQVSGATRRSTSRADSSRSVPFAKVMLTPVVYANRPT